VRMPHEPHRRRPLRQRHVRRLRRLRVRLRRVRRREVPRVRDGDGLSWTTSQVRCDVCTHVWTATVEGCWTGDPRLECPNCGNQAGDVIDDDEEEDGGCLT
jgi:hypothetical protein